MSAETVEALWVGPFEASLPDGSRLTPNVSTCQVGRDEAEASANWQIPTPAKAPTSSPAAPSAPPAPEKE